MDLKVLRTLKMAIYVSTAQDVLIDAPTRSAPVGWVVEKRQAMEYENEIPDENDLIKIRFENSANLKISSRFVGMIIL